MLELRRTAQRSTPEADRLLLEAQALAQLEGPGLPCVVRVGTDHDDPDQVELVTGFPPGVPLGDRVPLAPAEAAGVVMGLGTILAGVAARGVARDAVTVDQVHLGDGGRPVLRHLAGAAPSPTDTAVEVGASDLGAVLLRLLGPPVPARLWRLGPDPTGPLRALANRAADPALALELFLERLRSVAPEARLPTVQAAPGADTAGDHERGGSHRRRALVVAVAVTTMAIVTAAGLALVAGTSPATVELASPTQEAPGDTATQTEGEQAEPAQAEPIWPRPACASDGGGDVACARSLRLEGEVVHANGTSWRLAGDGDYVMALVDIDCSGMPVLVVLDRDGGDLWRLTPEPAGAPTAFLGRARGAAAVAPAPDGCGPPLLTSPEGAPVELVA